MSEELMVSNLKEKSSVELTLLGRSLTQKCFKCVIQMYSVNLGEYNIYLFMYLFYH